MWLNYTIFLKFRFLPWSSPQRMTLWEIAILFLLLFLPHVIRCPLISSSSISTQHLPSMLCSCFFSQGAFDHAVRWNRSPSLTQAKEMVKSLPRKNGDLSLLSNIHMKSQPGGWCLWYQHWGKEKRKSLGLTDQPAQPSRQILDTSETICLK